MWGNNHKVCMGSSCTSSKFSHLLLISLFVWSVTPVIHNIEQFFEFIKSNQESFFYDRRHNLFETQYKLVKMLGKILSDNDTMYLY